MGIALRSGRRLFALGLCCWVMAAPLTSFARDAVLCRHRAMHRGMPPGGSSGTSCWCNDMAGVATPIAAEAPTLPAEPIRMPSDVAPGLAIVVPLGGSFPASPSYAPTPPPPNERDG